MIEKIHIKNNKNVDRHYISKIPAFKNGKEYIFSKGVNIIVGENGCGKSTLINLIKDYLAVDGEWCGRGRFASVITKIVDIHVFDEKEIMYDGVEVFADYKLNTFCYTPFIERDNDNFMAAGRMSEIMLNVESNSMSKGQKATFALSTLFQKIFAKDAVLTFDYKKEFGTHQCYMDYIEKHRVKLKEPIWTILLDEPDCSVDIEKLKELYGILNFNKENTQIICVIHNPFLIAKLAKIKDINIIEMSKGYVKKIQKEIKEFEKL